MLAVKSAGRSLQHVPIRRYVCLRRLGLQLRSLSLYKVIRVVILLRTAVIIRIMRLKRSVGGINKCLPYFSSTCT